MRERAWTLVGWRLGAVAVGLALPFALVAAAAAQQVPPPDVAAGEITCADLGIDPSECTDAVVEGLVEITETDVNADLAAGGVAVTVDLGLEEGAEPGDVTPSSGNPPVPAVPVVPVPPVP